MIATSHSPASAPRTRGFLFGAGADSSAIDLSRPLYHSTFAQSRRPEYSFIDEQQSNQLSSPRTTTPRRALFNLAAPFARYLTAVATADLLIKLVSIPKPLITTSRLKDCLIVIPLAILLNDFLILALRRRGWFSQTAPIVNPTKRLGRQVFRRWGKHAWYAWYITQPARLLLVITVGWTLITLVAMAINSSPPIKPTELIQGIRWARNLLLLLGMGGLMWAAFNYMTEKNWTKQALGGVFCFAFSAMASLAYSFSQGNAADLDLNLGP